MTRADWRRIIWPAIGVGVILAVAGIVALNLAARGADDGDWHDEPRTYNDVSRYDAFCGGTPETILILCDFDEGGALSVYLSRDGRVRPLVDSGDGPGWYIGVDLSPDQKLLAITGAHGAGPTGYWLAIMDLERRRLRPIVGTATCWKYGWPAWSADGKQLSVTAARPDGREATIVLTANGVIVERDPVRGWPSC